MALNNKIEVLDHGFVRLIDYMGNDLSIVRNARLSYNAAWRAGKDTGSDEKLLRYLYRNGHNTPFEAMTLTFEVMAPIFVLRQWMRHRTQSYNELSARYKELPELFYVPDLEVITEQSKDNKQMRTAKQHPAASVIQSLIEVQNKESFEMYHDLLSEGCPRELARTVLPLGTYSHIFTTLNLHNLFKFLQERLHEHSQYEIRVYAQAILELVEPLAPVSVQAFKDYNNIENN